MIRDLLEATRAENGKLRIEPRCIALSELIRQAVAMMRPTAEGKHVGVEMGLDLRIPLVHADPDRVVEVLINLLDNAIKFTPAEGSVVVKACMVETDPGTVYVSVSDTGRGIGAESKALIFERLYQDPDAVDNNRSGLGLGLFICRELIRLHGGRIWLSSEPGQGSTFTFTLPIYSLANLLTPVIAYQDSLRPAFVLVRVELTPLSNPPRGNWRETCQQCLETLKRCVYLDKDLVLPPMGTSGPSETFFVVASTDLLQAGIMSSRIREQLENIAGVKEKGTLTISAAAIDGSPAAGDSLDQQIQTVADRVMGMVMSGLERNMSRPEKKRTAADSKRKNKLSN
jgi:hypothetical protein